MPSSRVIHRIEVVEENYAGILTYKLRDERDTWKYRTRDYPDSISDRDGLARDAAEAIFRHLAMRGRERIGTR